MGAHTNMSTNEHINMSTDGHINFTKDVVEYVDEEIEDSHTGISTDGYDVAQYEYKVLYVNDDMSTNYLFPGKVVRTIQWRNQV